jgi:hypothetical protein
MVHISEYDSHQHAGERFEMIRKEWWSEHRYPEGYKEPLINSHIGTMLKGGNGVAYGWQSGRHIFLLHFIGLTGEVPAEIFRDLPF